MRHRCEEDFPEGLYGAAITACRENAQGEFWVDNEEYATRVNFCPFCGAAAPKRYEAEDAAAVSSAAPSSSRS